MNSFQESYYLSDNEGYDDDFYSEMTLAEFGSAATTAWNVLIRVLRYYGLDERITSWSAKKTKNNLGRLIQKAFNIIKDDHDDMVDNIKELRKVINSINRECKRTGAKKRSYVFTDKELKAISDLRESCVEISVFIRNKHVMKQDHARFADRTKDFIECCIKCLEIVKDKPNE
ncbi:MAG: hypothetical protein IKA36_01725 [Clostridia bacterium]|nr:hypothetical protein [Clostridia bacterium]